MCLFLAPEYFIVDPATTLPYFQVRLCFDLEHQSQFSILRVIASFFQLLSSFNRTMHFIFVSGWLNCACMNSQAQVPLIFSPSLSFSSIKYSVCFQDHFLIISIDAFIDLSDSHSHMPLCWLHSVYFIILSAIDPCFSSPTNNWPSVAQSPIFFIYLIISSRSAWFASSM